MKANFKKLATAAGITAALGAMSMSAQAISVGIPGEAQLVPFFFWDGPATPANIGTLNANSVDTIADHSASLGGRRWLTESGYP